MKILIKNILLFMLLFCSVNVLADFNGWSYQVDLLVFEHITPQALMSQKWQAIQQQPDLQNSVTPTWLPPSQSKLNQIAKKLAANPNYKILANLSWQQEIIETKHPPIIHIIGGQNLGDSYQLNGTIIITQDRFFNVKANLILAENENYLAHFGQANFAPNIINNDPKTFQLLEYRRMRVNELNYLDHPLFGALLIITPLSS